VCVSYLFTDNTGYICGNSTVRAGRDPSPVGLIEDGDSDSVGVDGEGASKERQRWSRGGVSHGVMLDSGLVSVVAAVLYN
jgi:hypothetical protein